MTFKRVVDASYPCVYNTWEQEDATMVIQDLPPEDSEAALMILDKIDGTLSRIQNLIEDPESVREFRARSIKCLQQRMSLGCYVEKNAEKTLVAVSLSTVGSKGDEPDFVFKGEKARMINIVKEYAISKADPYEHTGLQTLLHSRGTIVKKEYRGRGLAEKLLAAREPLCLSQGIKGTAILSTGIASQKPAIRCGFQIIAEFPISELAEAGLPYPRDDERKIQYMIKKYT